MRFELEIFVEDSIFILFVSKYFIYFKFIQSVQYPIIFTKWKIPDNAYRQQLEVDSLSSYESQFVNEKVYIIEGIIPALMSLE